MDDDITPEIAKGFIGDMMGILFQKQATQYPLHIAELKDGSLKPVCTVCGPISAKARTTFGINSLPSPLPARHDWVFAQDSFFQVDTRLFAYVNNSYQTVLLCNRMTPPLQLDVRDKDSAAKTIEKMAGKSKATAESLGTSVDQMKI